MKSTLSIRFLLLLFNLLTGLLVTSSVMAAPHMTVAANIPEPSVTLPWAMAGCWEHELFIVKPTTPLVQQTATPE